MAEFALFGWLNAMLALLFGYLLGSVPFGLILTRLAGTTDIRTIGSKSIGATNVLRTGRKDLAIATVLLDALKGTIAVLIAARWGQTAAILAGLGAFLGHLFPIWLKFEGGKGVATFIGVIGVLWWPGLVLFGVIWLGIAYLTRYSSLAALVASLLTAMTRVLLDIGGAVSAGVGGVIVVMVGLLWWKHQPNIKRLMLGTEGKIGQKE
jgi:glycerol-3-phosphate acyltransferase PlsY